MASWDLWWGDEVFFLRKFQLRSRSIRRKKNTYEASSQRSKISLYINWSTLWSMDTTQHHWFLAGILARKNYELQRVKIFGDKAWVECQQNALQTWEKLARTNSVRSAIIFSLLWWRWDSCSTFFRCLKWIKYFKFSQRTFILECW